MKQDEPRILLAGGGTGGHIFPAISVAEEAVRRGGSVHFVGTADRMESKLVPAAGFTIEYIDVRPLVGGDVKQVMDGLISIPGAVKHASKLVKEYNPHVVVGVGGYVAGPVVLAAKLLGKPTALMEQNATLGLTNRLLSRIVSRAFVAYEETMKSFPEGRAELTGNPLRKSIIDAARERRNHSKDSNAPVHIVVMGGSQGARAIDKLIPEAISTTVIEREISVLHQCGEGNEAEVRTHYEAGPIRAEVVRFIEDVAIELLKADLVIARSGATTISEITAMGLPAILLPYPHHTDRQQEKNAEPMRRAGAALVFDENQTDATEIAEAISELLGSPERLDEASKSSSELGRLDAAQHVVNGLFGLTGK